MTWRELTDIVYKNARRAKRMREVKPSGKTDRELIDEAIAQGKITKCPDGVALNALKWGTYGKITS